MNAARKAAVAAHKASRIATYEKAIAEISDIIRTPAVKLPPPANFAEEWDAVKTHPDYPWNNIRTSALYLRLVDTYTNSANAFYRKYPTEFAYEHVSDLLLGADYAAREAGMKPLGWDIFEDDACA